MELMIGVFLFVCGAAFGSFAGVLAWRLHAKKDFVKGRSECEKCHHALGPLELIPIVGWLLIGGKCRHCKTPVSWQYPLAELITGSLFVVSYLFWPFSLDAWQGIALLVLWLSYIVMLVALVIYDLRWMLLPDKIIYPLIALGFVDAAIRVSLLPDASIVAYAQHVALGALGLAGVYGALYAVSKGKWVGFGDVKLGLFMGAVLGWPSLLVVVISNVIGFLVIVPGLLTGRLRRDSRIPFGPFLIVAFLIVGLFGQQIIDWYVKSFVILA